MKNKLIIFLLILMTIFSYSYDLRSINGYDWLSWSYQEKIQFIDGYMLGQFELGYQMVLKENILDYELMLDFIIYNTQDFEVLLEIDSFYLETKQFDYPLYVVVMLRNFRNVPNWDEISQNQSW